MTRARAPVPDGFVASAGFALRTPLQPFERFERWSDALEAPAAGDAALDGALARDRARLRAQLAAWLEDPRVREALLVASPDLHASLDAWRTDADGERGARIERALVRYLVRMCTRPTPFGLFAGHAVGTLGADTDLTLEGSDQVRRHARLDMDYLFVLAQSLARDPALAPRLVLRPNSSLYRAAGRIRLVESRLSGRVRSHHLVAIEPTDYLDATLARAAGGATREDLARPLAADATLAEAEAFVDQLVEAQVLVTDLEPPVTGDEPLREQARTLRAQAGAVTAAAALEDVQRELDALAAAPPGREVERYGAIVERLGALPAAADLPYLFQVDLVKSAPRATLGRAVTDEILRAVEALRRIAARPARTPLERFRDAFVERWEQRAVPLVEALDEEAGIGFDPTPEAQAEAAPLLDGLPLPRAPEDAARRRDSRLASLAGRGAAATPPLELTDADLDALAGGTSAPPLPDAFAAMATVMAPSRGALAAGDFRVLVEMADGPSGARLLGRFCHGDPRLRAAVEEHLRAEEALQPDALFAEIVHLPEGRVGNVLCRPALRAYEIPFLGRSGAPAAAQIALDDLLVAVEGGRVVLRSRRLGREVVPRLSTAHNWLFRSLGVYRFLCSLQEQGRAARLMWSWGALDGAPFLPRVVRGRAILARARWRVAKGELPDLAPPLRGAALAALRRWREERGVPRLAVLADLDNRLLVDFENVLAVESFAALVGRRDDFTLEELLPPADELVAEGPEGRFTHEIVVPFVRATPAPRPAAGAARPAGAASEPPRRFAPGSEWLYARLYSGPAGTDPLLREVVDPLLERVGGRLAGWFFLRYGDPGWHLRLRLRGEPRLLAGEALPALEALAAPRLADGRLARVALDTYEPEVERYGGPLGVALAERLFEADSRCVLAIVRTLAGDAGLEARWQLAARGSDLLLEDLGLSPERRVALLSGTREALARELHADRDFELALDRRFRERRAALERLFDPQAERDGELAPGLALLRERSARVAPLAAELREAERRGALTVPVETLALSFVHMHCNRLLRSAHRAQELAIQDFLVRLHRSRLGRARARGGVGVTS